VTGTTQAKGAWMRAETVGNRSHGSASSPRQCLIRGLDCDSCCRGFESHQPPQISCWLRAHKRVARPAKNSHDGNTRRPGASLWRRCCIGRMSRQAVPRHFPYCAKIQLPTTGEPLDNRARGYSLMRSQVPKGVTARQPESAAGSSLFAFCPQGGYRRSKWANVVAAPTKAMALCDPRRQPDLPQVLARTGIADRHAIGPRLTGAWKWNVDAQRAVVPSSQGMAERHHREPRGSPSPLKKSRSPLACSGPVNDSRRDE
jgi:hypothetical protein